MMLVMLMFVVTVGTVVTVVTVGTVGTRSIVFFPSKESLAHTKKW